MLDRRNFLRAAAASGLSPILLSSCGQAPETQAPGATPGAGTEDTDDGTDPTPTQLFSISLAQWSLHRRLQGKQGPKLDNLDFAATARSFDIGAIEYVNQFFKSKARDHAYLAEMKRRADDAGVDSLLIMVDGEGALGAPDEADRAKAIDNHLQWLEAAQFLGCHAIRVNAQSSGSYDEQRDRAADGLHRLCEKADPFGLSVIVENHGGLSSNGAWLAAVMEQVDHPRCGTLPDFGNFRLGGGKEYDRYKGVAELMPYAKAVSAKSHDFDAEGNETKTDYARMMQIVVDAGYHGWVGIEFEGGGSEDEGIRKTKALLERTRAAMG